MTLEKIAEALENEGFKTEIDKYLVLSVTVTDENERTEMTFDFADIETIVRDAHGLVFVYGYDRYHEKLRDHLFHEWFGIDPSDIDYEPMPRWKLEEAYETLEMADRAAESFCIGVGVMAQIIEEECAAFSRVSNRESRRMECVNDAGTFH